MINVINNNCFHMGMIVLVLIILWNKSWINIYVRIWGVIIMYLPYETSSRNQLLKIYSRNSWELKVLQILKIRKEKRKKMRHMRLRFRVSMFSLPLFLALGMLEWSLASSQSHGATLLFLDASAVPLFGERMQALHRTPPCFIMCTRVNYLGPLRAKRSEGTRYDNAQ